MSRSVQYSDDEILEDIKRVAEKLGRSPTQIDYHEHGNISFTTVHQRIGGWNEAKERAGLKTYSSAQYSDEEILEDIKRVAEILGRSPTIIEYFDHGGVSKHTIRNRFGSWNEAKKRVGLETYSPGEE